MLEIKNLTKIFEETILNSINMDFSKYDVYGIIGPEGAGKTSIFRCIAELYNKTSGEIIYKVKKHEIAYMPEKQSLYKDLSIDEHLKLFKEIYSLSEFEYKEKKEVLLQITNLKKFEKRPAGKLSGGMYKKLGLMCSLLSSPKLLLLDEPTNGVDPISRIELWDLLQKKKKEGIKIIISTSYMDEAEKCDFVYLLHKGNVLDEGNPRDLLIKHNKKNFNELFMALEELC